MEVKRILASYPGDCSFNADATKREDTVLIGIDNPSFTLSHKGISSVCELDHNFSVIYSRNETMKSFRVRSLILASESDPAPSTADRASEFGVSVVLLGISG